MTLGGWVGSAVAAVAVWLVLRRLAPRRSVDLSPLLFLKAPFNAAAFFARSRLRISRGAPTLVDEPKDELFDYLDGAERARAIAREAELRARYRLEAFHARSTRAVYRDGVYVLDVLEVALREAKVSLASESISAVDVGSKDFAYAAPLAAFYRWFGAAAPRRVALEGVEIDGYGIYADGHSRADYARAYAAQAGEDVRYTVADATRVARAGLSVVTLFYPFLFRFALLAWGLPLRHYDPARLLRHAASMLAPGGLYVVVTHTAEEKARLDELLAEMPELVVRGSVRAESLLVDYLDEAAERWVTVAERAGDGRARAG